MNDAVRTLQGVEDAKMKQMLQAVIAQNAKAVSQVASTLSVDPRTLEFLVIAECANRWLASQG